MKQGALSRRAREAGVTAEQLEDALDEDEWKAAVVELIVRAAPLDADVSGASRAVGDVEAQREASGNKVSTKKFSQG